ncbi:Hypothetical predicted protein [Mytilus galloprovincialis]|uniref:Uncharacterized protein n=1 Tax=Mytilus galloprovincialis TaxID=29158 RepID=A0A8B6DXI4_MYTGA|nr:Hypothetical predicted protein [Mytilus galloprovincialis]
MSSGAATREYSNFLVKYDDGIRYTCPRIRSRPKVVETENSEITSPTSSSPHSPQSPVASPYVIRKRKTMPKTTTSKKHRQEAVLLSMEEGIHDPYAYRSSFISPQLLPLHLEAPSPTSPIVPTPTPTETEPTAFTIQKTQFINSWK